MATGKEIKVQFYRNQRNFCQLAGIVSDFSHYCLSDELQEPCSVTINQDSTIDDLVLFVYFWSIVRKSKNTAMFTDSMLTREQAESIIDWIRCYSNIRYFDDKKDYCHISPGLQSLHGWGCKWLHTILRHGRFGRHNGVDWYKVGPFINGVQYIDKEQIRNMLKAESGAKHLSLCPFFSLDRAYQYVDQLPDEIDPRLDPAWVYTESDDLANPHEIIGVEPNPVFF